MRGRDDLTLPGARIPDHLCTASLPEAVGGVCVVPKDVQAVLGLLARSSNLINLLAVLATLNSLPETLLFVDLKNVHNSRISQRGISRRHITVS